MQLFRHETGLFYDGYISLSKLCIKKGEYPWLVCYNRKKHTTDVLKAIPIQLYNGYFFHGNLEDKNRKQVTVSFWELDDYYIQVLNLERFKTLSVGELKREHQPLFVVYEMENHKMDVVQVTQYQESCGYLSKVQLQYSGGSKIEIDAESLKKYKFFKA